MATLTVSATTDYTLAPNNALVNGQNITAITFTNPSNLTFATFAPSQFGGSNISNTVALTGSAATNQVAVRLTAGGTFSAAGWTFINWISSVNNEFVFLIGSTGAESLTGSSVDDVITGDVGADTMRGGGGNDQFNFNPGDVVALEIIDGGSGNDLISVGNSESIDFSAGTLISIETVRLAQGAIATFIGSQIGGSGILEVQGSTNPTPSGVVVNGALVNLAALTFTNWRVGGKLDTITINGTLGNDTLFGSSQPDTITSGSGFDLLVGGDGNDRLEGGFDSDTLYGGNGNDQIFAMTEASPTGSGANEVMAGEAGNDTLTGSQGSDYLYGGDDQDSLIGNGGNDVLLGEGGSDTMDGGVGNDYLYGGTGVNIMRGDNGIDVFISEGVSDLMEGGAETNFYYRFAVGGAQVNGGTGIDQYVGGAALSNDAFYGFDGDDFAFGGEGNDVLAGMGGGDVLIGENGDDTLEGGAGVNLLWANGTGNDQIRVGVGEGGTQVVDFFEAGGVNDSVRLIGSNMTSFADFQNLLTNYNTPVNGNMVVNTATSGILYLNLGPNQAAIWFQGVSVFALTAADFTFG
jgi:Ca2+-binding RTX toxin-like protein